MLHRRVLNYQARSVWTRLTLRYWLKPVVALDLGARLASYVLRSIVLRAALNIWLFLRLDYQRVGDLSQQRTNRPEGFRICSLTYCSDRTPSDALSACKISWPLSRLGFPQFQTAHASVAVSHRVYNVCGTDGLTCAREDESGLARNSSDAYSCRVDTYHRIFSLFNKEHFPSR